jgi:fructosamine-3-kinase
VAGHVGGGDINEAVRLVCDEGRAWFLKWNRHTPTGMFAAEADGLAALAEAGAPELRVPEVIASSERPEGLGWLLLEHLEPARPGEASDWGVDLGRALARMHRAPATAGAPEGWGWSRSNFIGRLPQANAPTGSWADFWRERRIEPQLRLAVDRGLVRGADREECARLLREMEALLAGVDDTPPSLLHGDLWGGNVMATAEGRPAIYDPTAYRGHREVDLAMSELFGFPADFLPAYREAWPVPEAYDRGRRDLYQLYYLLVHVNLFGSGYLGRTRAAVRAALSAI